MVVPSSSPLMSTSDRISGQVVVLDLVALAGPTWANNPVRNARFESRGIMPIGGLELQHFFLSCSASVRH